MPNTHIPNTFFNPTEVAITESGRLVIRVSPKQIMQTSPIVEFTQKGNHISIKTKSGSVYMLVDVEPELAHHLALQHRANLFNGAR